MERSFCDFLIVNWVSLNWIKLSTLKVYAIYLLGGISIAWYKSNGTPGVLHIQPFNSKDFSTRSLSDRLSDLEELTTLYPNIDKKEAFDKYKVYEGNLYSPNNGLRRQEYVKAFMRLVVQPTEEVYVSNSVLSPIS